MDTFADLADSIRKLCAQIEEDFEPRPSDTLAFMEDAVKQSEHISECLEYLRGSCNSMTAQCDHLREVLMDEKQNEGDDEKKLVLKLRDVNRGDYQKDNFSAGFLFGEGGGGPVRKR